MIRLYAVLSAFMLLMSAPADASPFVCTAGTTDGPIGGQLYIMQHLDQFVVTGAPALAMSKATWKVVSDINRKINQRIQPKNDQPGNDQWSQNPAQGDCDDYVVSKRAALLAQGFASDDLQIAVVDVVYPDGEVEGHAILIVHTTRGDFVLDNRTPKILPWNQTGYRFKQLLIPRGNAFEWIATC